MKVYTTKPTSKLGYDLEKRFGTPNHLVVDGLHYLSLVVVKWGLPNGPM